MPSLVEPVHIALFRPRSAPLGDSTSDSGSALHSDRDESSSASPRLHTVRYAALDALQALAAVASRALIPFWGMFLPDRDGVPRRAAHGRDTLASIILFEKDVQLRSNAVTAVTALLASTRTFIQNATQVARPAEQERTLAFTSTSSRVLRASAALHTVVASAIRAESSGVVVAKLAKLAAELTSSMPVPAVSYQKVDNVLQSLRKRLLDVRATDLTSRAASASAVAVALGKSGEHMPVADLALLCEELTEVLKCRGERSEQPVLELLGVLRNAVVLKPCLFRRMWEDMKLPLLDLAAEGSTPGQLLHCVRLVEAFVAETAKLHAGMDCGALTEVEKDDVERDLVLAWDLYRCLLKGVMQDAMHLAQASAVSTVGSIMHLTGFVHAKPRKGVTAGDTGLGKAEPVALEEAIEILKGLVVSDCSGGVRICALKSLSSTPVNLVSEELARSVLRQLDDAIRNDDNDLNVRGKAMTSFAGFMDAVSIAVRGKNEEMTFDLEAVARFAADFLKSGNMTAKNGKAATSKSSAESSDVAAVNLVACALRHQSILMDRGSDAAESIMAARDDHALALSWVLRSGKSVNTKCMCCRAIGQVLQAELDRIGHLTLISDKVLVEALEWSVQHGVVRLQLASANVLRDVAVTGQTSGDIVRSLRLSIRIFESASCMIKSNQIDAKERTQFIALQSILAETIFETLRGTEEDVTQGLVQSWRGSPTKLSSAHALVDAVFRHLSLPSLIARQMKVSLNGDLVLEHEENARLLLETLSTDSQTIVRLVLGMEKFVTST